MRSKSKKLALGRTTIARLTSPDLVRVRGGVAGDDTTNGTFRCTGSHLNCTTSCGCTIFTNPAK
jgi:hypothetical protein